MRGDVSGASVELRNLGMRYDGHDGNAAVDDVSLSVASGELLTLLGPSGSGKTTTLNLIAGFLRPSVGSIAVDDVEIQDVPPHRRNIGMVFQHYALFPHMTSFENVAFPLKRRRIKAREVEERVTRALSLVGLTGYERYYPRQLSGGQQQRVAFARAVVFNPRLLVMDEPLGALDRKLRETLQLEVKRLHRELGITFLYVTHDQIEALALSERIAVFNKGRIEQIGTPTEVYEQPANLFVADFVGDSTQFAGSVEGEGEHVKVVGERWTLRARNTHKLSRADACVLVVRPEKLSVRPVEPMAAKTGEDERNTVLGCVRDMSYLGATQQVQIELAGGSEAHALREPGVGPSLNEGDTVELAWSPEDAVLLPAGRPVQ